MSVVLFNIILIIKTMPTKKTTVKKTAAKKTGSAKKSVTKSVAKKSTAKKATTKKTATKAGKSSSKSTKAKKAVSKNEKVLVCADGEECFWTTDGQILADLNQLQMALASMDDSVFFYHVNEEKNDFAEWVEAVLMDFECAQDLRKASAPKDARTVVVRHLRTYRI